MNVLSTRTVYFFIAFTIIFGIIEALDKIVFQNSDFIVVDIIGTIIIVVGSSILLFWEANKVILSHHPIAVKIGDIGNVDQFGIDTGQLDQDQNPMEGVLTIMLRRKGISTKIVRPKNLKIKARARIQFHFRGGSIVDFEHNTEKSVEKDGFATHHYDFDQSIMEEELLAYNFRIRIPRTNPDTDQPFELGTLPDIEIKVEYSFGYFKKLSLSAIEKISIKTK